MTFDRKSLLLLDEALAVMEEGYKHLPDFETPVDSANLRAALLEVAEKMKDNYPYHHPLYVGQMLKPPHPVARLAYAMSMLINPNNHALDGGRASSAMEKEAVAMIAKMFEWEEHLGHLCGGGTIANFEALWIARELRPGKAIAASEQAHYTHLRLSSVLGVPFRSIPVDSTGCMNIAALDSALATNEVGTVVVTLGTTAAGRIDPLSEVLALRKKYEFRIHVDAAYGGYFKLASNLSPDTRRAFEAISEADSIVIDPHKHGLQPYGCGCVLFRDPAVGRFYKHDSKYTYFTSSALHLGEISLECSRPGASAVALWTTMRMLPPQPGSEFAQGLSACREAALMLYASLRASERFVPLFTPELDIVVWAARAKSASESSAAARRVFEECASRDLHLALATFPRIMVEPAAAVQNWDEQEVVCLRACVMKPEHREWMPEILKRMNS